MRYLISPFLAAAMGTWTQAQDATAFLRIYQQLKADHIVTFAYPGHMVLIDCEPFNPEWTLYVMDQSGIRETGIAPNGPLDFKHCAWRRTAPAGQKELESNLLQAIDARAIGRWHATLDTPMFGLFVSRGSNFSCYIQPPESSKSEGLALAVEQLEEAVDRAKSHNSP